MSAEEIRVIVESAIQKNLYFEWWPYLVIAILSSISAFFGAWLKKRGEDFATKQSIRDLTHLVETIKEEIRRNETIAQAKRQMKHDACLNALSVIDGFFSHFFIGATPQSVDASKNREAHNKLILACDNPKIVELFTEILCGPSNGSRLPPTDQLNELRNLIREELGFGKDSDVVLDRDRAWFGHVVGDPKKPVAIDSTPST